MKYCPQHKIKYDVLYIIVLEQTRSYAAKALGNESEVLHMLAHQSQSDITDERSMVEKSITDGTTWLATLDKLIAKLYEDMIAQRISAENFNAILAISQNEQKALRER